MTESFATGRAADELLILGLVLAVTMFAAVVVERAIVAANVIRHRRIEQRYAPIVVGALAGDVGAERVLAASPSRCRYVIATLLIAPLIEDRNPKRIARTRAIVEATSLLPLVDRLLRSRFWWRRALGVRVAGGLQIKSHAAAIVAALDDPHAEVRGAALDAIADSHDPALLPALVVRLQDASLHRGRRAAAIAAFGPESEPFLLDLAAADAAHRASYALILTICGTARARPALCEWTADPRVEVRTAAFEALAHVGLDEASARLAVDGLHSGDAGVRAAAAFALHDWSGPGDAPQQLARHLDDAWAVAIRAAHTLQTMREPGLAALRASAARTDLAGTLARQMLWEVSAQ